MTSCPARPPAECTSPSPASPPTCHNGLRGPGCMRCNRLRSWIAAPGDENAPVVRRRRNTLARESPLRCMARGPRVPLIAAASAWVCVLAEDPPGDAPPAVVREEVVAVEVLFERVAGLDIGKNSLTVCRRTPGAGGHRISETRTFPTTTRALNVMRDWLLRSEERRVGKECRSRWSLYH